MTTQKQLARMGWRWTLPAVGLLSATFAVGADGPAPTPPAAHPTTAPTLASENASIPGAMLVTEGLDDHGGLSLTVNKSSILRTRRPLKRVSISQPDVADVNTIGPSEVLVNAKKPGTTQLILWDDTDHSQVIDVQVGVDLAALQAQIGKMFPGSSVEVSSATNNALILRGRVPNLIVAQQVTAVAAPYAASVINLLEVSGGQQVVLQVRFAEVSRSATTNLGFNAFASDGVSRGGFNNGPGDSTLGGLASGATSSVDGSVALFGAGRIGGTAFELFVEALRQNSLLRVLAEPNLIAMSGQEASFLAGGEFPIPVPQSGGGGGGTAITIEYKQFGIRLKFTPVVLGDGHIRLKVSPEVSDLDYSNSVSFNGFVIPSITERKLETEVELSEGQTFSVAGLLNNRVNANRSVTPLLGDLPVLGALFRSVRYTQSETELVVLVTPRLASGLNPGSVPTLPGEHWRFPTEEQLFWDRDLGGPAPDLKDAPPTKPGAPATIKGAHGFAPATGPTTDAR